MRLIISFTLFMKSSASKPQADVDLQLISDNSSGSKLISIITDQKNVTGFKIEIIFSIKSFGLITRFDFTKTFFVSSSSKKVQNNFQRDFKRKMS